MPDPTPTKLLPPEGQAALEAGYWFQSRRADAAEAENAKLREELAEYVSDSFYQIASKGEDGWYNTMALSTAKAAGEKLVELGLMEASPKNKRGSRVAWYRPVSQPDAAQGKGTGQ